MSVCQCGGMLSVWGGVKTRKESHTLRNKGATVYRTLEGSSAGPIGEPFEEPFLVAGKTLLVPGRTLLGSM